jgi:ABC-type lipoprotein export system ATPase subunit
MTTAPQPREGVALVRCDNVARTYGRGPAAVVAVHGATCEIWPEQCVAITGPSGSGKSTLLHLLAGLDDPTAGTVTWPALGDRSTLRPGPVGVVFQGPSLLPALDVTENVALPALLSGESERNARRAASNALDLLGLDGLGAKLPEELSGGQSQRVAVARVLAGRPLLIVADEPTGQLDHTVAGQVIDALLHAALRLGAGLIISTHDPAIAARCVERWEMRDGALAGATTRSEGAVVCSA